MTRLKFANTVARALDAFGPALVADALDTREKTVYRWAFGDDHLTPQSRVYLVEALRRLERRP